jgi:signal transduction histidine kinase
VYDIALYKLKYLGLLYILPLLQSTQIHNIKVSGIIVIVSIIAFIMEYRTEKHDKLLHDYMRLRDTSAELNFYLSKKNRMLMENQDYEIHVATLKERNRIAREIHDNVGHMISRSILQVGALMTICKDEVSSTNLLSLKDTLNEAMNSIRESVHGLHEDSIDLYASINGITQKFQDYQITVDYDMSESVSRNIKYCFISVIKEAISNVVKHSNADKIDIIVREHPMFYQLLIKDNGTCRMENRTPEGIGLENMNARVLNLNGNISIDSKDGFKIFISIPKGSDEEEQNENSNRRR